MKKTTRIFTLITLITSRQLFSHGTSADLLTPIEGSALETTTEYAQILLQERVADNIQKLDETIPQTTEQAPAEEQSKKTIEETITENRKELVENLQENLAEKLTSGSASEPTVEPTYILDENWQSFAKRYVILFSPVIVGLVAAQLNPTKIEERNVFLGAGLATLVPAFIYSTTNHEQRLQSGKEFLRWADPAALAKLDQPDTEISSWSIFFRKIKLAAAADEFELIPSDSQNFKEAQHFLQLTKELAEKIRHYEARPTTIIQP